MIRRGNPRLAHAWWAARVAILLLTMPLAPIGLLGHARGQEPPRGLGFTPLPATQLLSAFEAPIATDPLPPHIDWRDEGIITPARDQGSCSACWAFAAIGLLEAKAVQAGAPQTIDLSEQYVISCDHDPWWIGHEWAWNEGCCGGTIAVFEFLSINPAVLETDFHYAAGDSAGTRDCGAGVQSIPIVPCPRADPPPDTDWWVTNWSVVSAQQVATVHEMRSALLVGPLWVGFYVYPDFRSYWDGGPPGTYRRTTTASPEGGHAVLLIGYDEAGEYWICKNSWGAVAGPFGDGTFRMAWDSNCDFGLNATAIAVLGQGLPTPVRDASWGRLRDAYR
jgi:hypothetical protein